MTRGFKSKKYNMIKNLVKEIIEIQKESKFPKGILTGFGKLAE